MTRTGPEGSEVPNSLLVKSGEPGAQGISTTEWLNWGLGMFLILHSCFQAFAHSSRRATLSGRRPVLYQPSATRWVAGWVNTFDRLKAWFILLCGPPPQDKPTD